MASTQLVRMPIAAAMRRFWVTARISQAEAGAADHRQQGREHDQAEDDDAQPALR